MTSHWVKINIKFVMNRKTPSYKLINHTADVGIIVKADNLEKLFKEAALSLIHLITGKLPSGKIESIELSIEGEDLIDLMVNWLSEILYLFEGEKKLLTDVKIKFISPKKISATVDLIPFDEEKHEILCEIKAVTYHQLDVTKKNDHWETKIIFDV